MKRILKLSAIIAGIAILEACDPDYLTSWYIENLLGEDIFVTRSDSSEISNVFIPNGGIECIYQESWMGGAPFYRFEDSFSSDTLIILSTSYDTLYKFHPAHHSKPYPNEEVAMNMHFWDMDNWVLNVDHKKLTISWFYTLRPDSVDDSWISRP